MCETDRLRTQRSGTVRPSVEAVARLTAEHDPAARRRWVHAPGVGFGDAASGASAAGQL